MLLVYMCGSLSYQWSLVGHALQHILTQSDFRHTHGMGLATADDEIDLSHSHKQHNFGITVFENSPSKTHRQQLSTLKMFKHVCVPAMCFDLSLYPCFTIYDREILISSLVISPPVPPPQS